MTGNKDFFQNYLDFLAVDLFSLLVSFILSYRFRFGNFGFYNFENWTYLLLVILMLDVIITLIINPYHGIFRRAYYQEIIRCIQLTVYNFLIAAIIFYLLKIGAEFSRKMMVTAYILYFLLSLIAKYILKKLIVTHHEKSAIPLFIIGNSSNIETVIENITAGEFKLYDICGIHLIDDPDRNEPVQDIPVISKKIMDFINTHHINEVLTAIPPVDLDFDLRKALVENGISVFYDIDTIAGFHPEYETIRSFGIRRWLGIGSFSFSTGQYYYLSIKRFLDIMISLIGCIFLLPVYLIVRLAYILSGDRKKILYSQKRLGLEGEPINIYKFRSMVPNAEEMLEELLQEDKYCREWEENQKLTDDPRITKVGRFLRKTSIDELPQLINVLKGEMSLVGPRPLVEGELELHNGLKLYQKVKPGITGWWACNGRSNISYQERLELEYYYVKHVSLYLDLLCIFRTAFSVLSREGAQ